MARGQLRGVDTGRAIHICLVKFLSGLIEPISDVPEPQRVVPVRGSDFPHRFPSVHCSVIFSLVSGERLTQMTAPFGWS